MLSPNYCLFCGVSTYEYIKNYLANDNDSNFILSPSAPLFDEQKINGAYPKSINIICQNSGKDITLIFIKHPSQYFSHSIWRRFLQNNFPELISSFNLLNKYYLMARDIYNEFINDPTPFEDIKIDEKDDAVYFTGYRFKSQNFELLVICSENSKSHEYELKFYDTKYDKNGLEHTNKIVDFLKEKGIAFQNIVENEYYSTIYENEQKLYDFIHDLKKELVTLNR